MPVGNSGLAVDIPKALAASGLLPHEDLAEDVEVEETWFSGRSSAGEAAEVRGGPPACLRASQLPAVVHDRVKSCTPTVRRLSQAFSSWTA